MPSDIDKARVMEYALELQKLANQYGLRCDWMIEKLHPQIRHLIDPSFRILYGIIQADQAIDDFKLNFPVVPNMGKEIDRKYKEELQRIRSNPAYNRRQKPPQDFDLAVECLALWLIFGLRPERITDRVNFETKSKGGDYLTADIESYIKKAARLLDIKLFAKRQRKTKRI